MTKKIGTSLDHFAVICGNKNDYFYLAIEINVLLGNARYPENFEDASDVNRLALCGPSLWREHVSARGQSQAFSFPALPISQYLLCNNNSSNNNNKKIGATETISKSFRKYVSTIPGNHDVRELQKSAILGTAHILRKVLM
jgi:hypothetical protein